MSLSFLTMAPVVKNPSANAGDVRDVGSIPGLGRSPGRGHIDPPQSSCLENPKDRGTRQNAVLGSDRAGHDWSNLACMQIPSKNSKLLTFHPVMCVWSGVGKKMLNMYKEKVSSLAWLIWVYFSKTCWKATPFRINVMVRYTLLYLKWITNKGLLNSTWNSTPCYVPAWIGGRLGGEWIHVYLGLSLFAAHLEGNGSPLQYSCLESPMDRGAWQATVHGVAKSRIRLSNFTSLFT